MTDEHVRCYQDVYNGRGYESSVTENFVNDYAYQ